MRLLTPAGPGGIAVLAVDSADEARALLACLSTPGGLPLATVPEAPPRRCLLALDGIVRDEVLLVDRGPAGLELHLHGSPTLVDSVLERFGTQRRPVATAEELLRSALSDAQLTLALEQRAHDFAAFLTAVRALPTVERTRALAAARARSRTAMALATPHRLLLIGQQNAGKSTLFNRLLCRERAVTGPLPGLTRDPVAEVTCLAGYPYELIDTAGEGEAPEPVAVAAIARARELRAAADALLLIDGSRGPTAADLALWGEATLVIATKADLEPSPWPAGLPCALRLSGLQPASAPAIRVAVGELLRRWRGLPAAGPVGGPAALTAAELAALLAASAATGSPA